ncbi:MAG TPA: phosphoribosylamine--glycine ligase [Pseudoneobacillus sp.]|nr:phosphoribosylamine--glycine ligase [Pseudoneobacillus sp.]
MKVLVVGRGGREHAICHKFSESALVEKVYVAPGNPGMREVAKVISIDENNHDELIQFAKQNDIGLTFIGPEIPLLGGLADRFLAEGLKVFGPTQNAALIEGSKSFAKELMKKYSIPTAEYEVFNEYEAALKYVEDRGAPIVIKADGLAAGKGVVVAMTMEEAQVALKDMLMEQRFGQSSASVVIEEFLQGEEFSLMAFVNGDKVTPLEIAQDHKRAFDGDQGPNTGGMGAYSPVPQIPAEAIQIAIEKIVKPTAQALVQEGRKFCGVLYAGLILTEEGPKVIEYNARFGDPETQVLLPRMKSDLLAVLLQVLNGEEVSIEWDTGSVIGVVLAAEGYPGELQTKGKTFSIPCNEKEVQIYHAGTDLQNGDWLINGGRVILVAAKGKTLPEAKQGVYSYLTKQKWDGLFFRKDIGNKAISHVSLNV